MSTTAGAESEKLEDLVRRCYCLGGPDGREDPQRLRKAIQAVTQSGEASGDHVPEIDGVPRLRCRIDRLSQIPEAVRRFLPEVEADPRLHALSFVDPLLVANELGISVAPAVARTVRRGLASAVTFDLASLDADGRLRGVGTIRWRPKAGVSL